MEIKTDKRTEEMETGILRDKERVKDSRRGTEAQVGGDGWAPGADKRVTADVPRSLARYFNPWPPHNGPITHPRQRFPNPERIHRCR